MISSKIETKLIYSLLFAVLICVFLFFTIGSILKGHFSVTYDEPSHFRYGEMIYQGSTTRFDDSKMPASALNIIPGKVADKVFGVKFSDYDDLIKIGRISTALISLLLGFLCYFWASNLYGKFVGLIAFFLFVFEPNIIAHSQLVTTDIYAAASVTLALFFTWRFLELPNFQRGWLLGLAVGLCQISKYSGVLIIPAVALLTLIRYGKSLIVSLKRREVFWPVMWKSIGYTALIALTALFVINIAFYFDRSGTALREYQFQSVFFNSLQNKFPRASRLPIPLPYSYLQGLDAVLFRERSGGGHGPIYLLGNLSGNGFLGYYIIASFLKIPIPILVFFFVSLWDWVRSFQSKEFVSKEMYLLLPALLYSLYFNFFNQAQIGIRFYLVIFPVFIIFSARIFCKWRNFSRKGKFLFLLAGSFLLISVFSYYPDYISYFNEIVFNRDTAYRYLADSNLDWGQNDEDLKEFINQNPDFQLNPTAPTPGKIIVGTNQYLGILGSPENYRWLRDQFKPTDTFQQTHLIFDIPQSNLEESIQ